MGPMSITENKNKTKNIIEKKIISAVVFAVWSVSANKCSFSPHKEAKVKNKTEANNRCIQTEPELKYVTLLIDG